MAARCITAIATKGCAQGRIHPDANKALVLVARAFVLYKNFDRKYFCQGCQWRSLYLCCNFINVIINIIVIIRYLNNA